MWVASVDFREEVRFGPEIMARVVEAYRKLRNTLRILAANLSDFNPATDMVPPLLMDDVDRFAMARYGELASKIMTAYERYDFPAIFQALNAFVAVDLSAFYVDVTKDRVYTLAAGSRGRRSAQTAMFAMADGLARLIAPVLPVLAEEFWSHLPGPREESVHLAAFPKQVHLFRNDELEARWSRLLKLRAAVNVELEKLRQSKGIGQSLEAVVHLARRRADRGPHRAAPGPAAGALHHVAGRRPDRPAGGRAGARGRLRLSRRRRQRGPHRGREGRRHEV